MGIHRFVVTVVGGVAVWGASLVSLQARQSHIHTMAQNQGLVDVVRSAVQQFSDPSAAEDADYHPFAGCVSGPQSGAMGVHYVNGGLVGDGVVDEQHPEALVYEPKTNHLELVAVEYIVLASQWDAAHTDNLPPTLRGQVFQFNSAPNRYRLPAFYELHVWVGRENPSGAFADWNPNVSCSQYAP
jgi:hypothetical protein